MLNRNWLHKNDTQFLSFIHNFPIDLIRPVLSKVNCIIVKYLS